MPAVLTEIPEAADAATSAAQDLERLNISGSIERLNISADGKRFKCWFATPGVVNYADCGDGCELITKDAIDAGLETMIGAPLTIGHVPTTLTRGELGDYANGYVDRAYFDPETAWYCCEGTVDTDQAKKAIEAGHGVSAGTRVPANSVGPAGTWLQVPYVRELLRVNFHHLAIVPPGGKARYEEALIRLNSLKQPSAMPATIKLFKRLTGQGAVISETSTEVSAEVTVSGKDGKRVTIAELLEHERLNHVHSICRDDMVECGGVRYHVGTLLDHHDAHQMASMAGHHQMPRLNAEQEKEEADKKEAADKAKAEELERANAVKAEEDRLKAEKEAADNKTKDDADAAELERQNAVRLADDQKAAQDAAAKAAQEKADADKAEELERQNAVRRQGAQSFQTLSTAQQRQSTVTSAPLVDGRTVGRAKGKQMFGSN